MEAGRTDVASRDAQWRTNSQLAVEQMTQLKDENEDLRFQVCIVVFVALMSF